MFCHIKLTKCDPMMTHTNHYPLPSLYVMPMVCFIFILFYYYQPMLCHVKSMKRDPMTTHTDDQPPPPACAMSMA